MSKSEPTIPPTAPKVTRLRVSLVHVETLLDVVTGSLAKPAFAFLANRFAFAEAFDAALKDRSGTIQPPWPDTEGKKFWVYYFGQLRLASVDGQQAWRNVLPVRTATGSATAVDERVRTVVEGYVYPHGVAVVANLYVDIPLALPDAARAAVHLRRDPAFVAAGGAGPQTIDSIAGRGLAQLRAKAFGADVQQGRRTSTPFTVATIVSGANVDPTRAVADGGAEHRLLDALTTWSANWDTAALGTVAEHTLPSRTNGVPAGHVVYKHARARAVWFPGSFTRASGSSMHTLGCFHRNLVLASLQVESLAGLAAATAATLPGGSSLAETHRAALVSSGYILGRLYGGVRDGYRSRSPQVQMDDGGYVPDIDAVRALVGQPALFVPPAAPAQPPT